MSQRFADPRVIFPDLQRNFERVGHELREVSRAIRHTFMRTFYTMPKAHASIAVGEITYPMQLGVNEMIDLEELFDLPVNSVLIRITNPATLRIGDLAKVLAATVQADGKSIDIVRAKAIADTAGLPATTKAVTDLLADLLNSGAFSAPAEV